MKKYLKKIILSSKEIIVTYILQFVTIIISYTIYSCITKKTITNYMNCFGIIITIIFCIITSLIFYKKNNIIIKQLSSKNYYYLISLGISISCLFNMILFKFVTPKPVSNSNSLLLFISSAIIGPIYEEILFRHILLNKLKKFNSPTKSIIISTLIFSLLHLNPIKIIYAFILGLFLNIIYHKTNNLISSILIHISANSISLLLNQYNKHILLLTIILFFTLFTLLDY